MRRFLSWVVLAGVVALPTLGSASADELVPGQLWTFAAAPVLAVAELRVLESQYELSTRILDSESPSTGTTIALAPGQRFRLSFEQQDALRARWVEFFRDRDRVYVTSSDTVFE